jgi:hypothetical protein
MASIKYILSICVTLSLTHAVLGQNFSGSDDFSSDSGNWSPDTSSGTASPDFTVTGGVLDFTSSAPAGAEENTVYRTWTANYGSYTSDWSVYADFTLTPSWLDADQNFSLSLAVLNSEDTSDRLSVSLVWNSAADSATGFPVVTVFDGTNGGQTQIGGPVSLTSTTGSLGLVYESATQTLRAGYDANGPTGGHQFTSITSFDVSSWSMSVSGTFVALLHGNNSTGASGGNGISTGQATIDDFTVLPYAVTAVPESSTYALAIGVAGLGLVLLRRRRGCSR